MSALQEIERLLQSLTAAEKAHLLQTLAGEAADAFPGIESNPEVCGGEPCVVRTRIPVWLLEQARRLGATDAALLQSYPTLRAADLALAWAHVRSHRAEIEEAIRVNKAA